MSNYQRKCTPTEVVSPKQVEDLFSSLVDALQTPETEHTWLQKELELNKLRSMLITYPKWEGDYQIVDRFLNGLRSQGFVDGLVNAMSTLRTTLCITACTTVTELAETFRTDMDQFSEIWIRNLLKLIFQTKRLTLNASSDAIRAILRNSSYSGRLLNTLFTYASEKNPQVRLQISNFFTVILESHSAKLEKSGGLEIIEKIIEKSVGDANPRVREAARGLFGLYAAKFSDRTDRLQQTFSSAARKSLAASSKSRTTSTSSAIKPSAVSHSNKDNLNRSHSTNTRSPCTQRVKTVQTKPLEVATSLLEHSDPQVRLSGIHAMYQYFANNGDVSSIPRKLGTALTVILTDATQPAVIARLITPPDNFYNYVVKSRIMSLQTATSKLLTLLVAAKRIGSDYGIQNSNINDNSPYALLEIYEYCKDCVKFIRRNEPLSEWAAILVKCLMVDHNNSTISGKRKREVVKVILGYMNELLHAVCTLKGVKLASVELDHQYPETEQQEPFRAEDEADLIDFFGQPSNIKLFTARLIPLLTTSSLSTTASSSSSLSLHKNQQSHGSTTILTTDLQQLSNYHAVIRLLKILRILDQKSFDFVLQSLEMDLQTLVRNLVGINEPEECVEDSDLSEGQEKAEENVEEVSTLLQLDVCPSGDIEEESFPMADDLQSNTFLTTTSASSKSLISAPPSPGSPQSPFLSTSHPPPSATGLKSLKSLIHAISSRNADESTFMSLIRTVRDADISDSAFSRGDRGGEEETDTTQLLNCVIDFVSDERLSSELRETCIIAFTQIIMLQSLAFEGFLLKILRAAFGWRVSKSAPVASSANELLLTISTVFKPSNIFATTSAYLAELSEFSIEVTSAFYLLSESLFLFNRNEVYSEVMNLKNEVLKAFNNSIPEIRKSTVDFLVSVNSNFPDSDFQSLLQALELSTAQTKILKVYIDACMHEQTQNNNGKHDNTGRRFNASKFDDNMRGDGERARTFSQIQKRKGFLVPGSGPRMGHGDKGI